MNTRMFFVVSCFLFALTAATPLNRTAAAAASIDVPRMSIEQANQMHGNPDVIFIDVRTAASWWRSTSKITQAIREDPKAVAQWAPKYAKSKTLILYCAWKNEGTSARVARYFIENGYPNVFALQGGWVAWTMAGYATEKK